MKNILAQITLIESMGFVFSVIQVILARYNNPNNYLFGIIGILLTLILMFQNRLYAEFGLNIYYLVMSIYGWIYWLYGKNHRQASISYANKRDWMIVGAILGLSFGTFYIILHHFTNSDVVIADSLVSSFAWAGMWLMAKRKIENWILLNISNAISLPLLLYKELYLYAILSIILFIVAVSGYLHWKKLIKMGYQNKKYQS